MQLVSRLKAVLLQKCRRGHSDNTLYPEEMIRRGPGTTKIPGALDPCDFPQGITVTFSAYKICL